MQFEPHWSLTVIVAVSLAALYVWYLLSQATILDKPLGKARERFGSLIGCSWCAGFYLTGIALLVTGTYDPLTHLAAAGSTGILGSHSG